MASVLWLHGGACSGNTMSFLNADEPERLSTWSPTSGMEICSGTPPWVWSWGSKAQKPCSKSLRQRRDRQLDIFVFEGTVIERSRRLRPLQHLRRPAHEGLGESSWLGGGQHRGGHRRLRLLGWNPGEPSPTRRTPPACNSTSGPRAASSAGDFVSKAGLPVINIPGCPAHPDWVTQILVAIASGRAGDIALDEQHRPADVLHVVHPDRLHPQPVLRIQAVHHRALAKAPAPAVSTTSSVAVGR